jgi:hypothetical protein
MQRFLSLIAGLCQAYPSGTRSKTSFLSHAIPVIQVFLDFFPEGSIRFVTGYVNLFGIPFFVKDPSHDKD